MENFMDYLSLAGTVLCVIGIVVLAFYSTKWLGKRMGASSSGKYLSVVDKIAIGQDKSIAIVKFGEKYVLVGIASSSINILSELTSEDIIQITPKESSPPLGGTISFSDALKENLKKYNVFGAKNGDKEHDKFE